QVGERFAFGDLRQLQHQIQKLFTAHARSCITRVGRYIASQGLTARPWKLVLRSTSPTRTASRPARRAGRGRSPLLWRRPGRGGADQVLGADGSGAGMALSMRVAAMAAAVGRVSVLRARVRAEAPSRSSASCSPSCSGLVAPASRAVSMNRAATAFL